MSLEQARDIVIIIYGVLGILLFLVLIVVSIGLWFAVRSVTRSVRALINDPISPAVSDVRSIIHDVRGTTEFVADTAVSPLIRVSAAVRGIKRGVSVAAGFARRRG